MYTSIHPPNIYWALHLVLSIQRTSKNSSTPGTYGRIPKVGYQKTKENRKLQWLLHDMCMGKIVIGTGCCGSAEVSIPDLMFRWFNVGVKRDLLEKYPWSEAQVEII